MLVEQRQGADGMLAESTRLNRRFFSSNTDVTQLIGG